MGFEENLLEEYSQPNFKTIGFKFDHIRYFLISVLLLTDKPFHWSSLFFTNVRLINLTLVDFLVELLWNANPINYRKGD